MGLEEGKEGYIGCSASTIYHFFRYSQGDNLGHLLLDYIHGWEINNITSMPVANTISNDKVKKLSKYYDGGNHFR